MAIRTTVTLEGGERLRKVLRDALKGGVAAVEVGFFSTARYPDGTPVAAVAAWNEFGTKRGSGAGRRQHVPERPFFRQAIKAMESGLVDLLIDGIDPKKGVVDRHLADRIGAYAQGQVQKQIIELDTPINADSTVARKGSSNPLVDTGTMRNAVTWKVNQ